jgi:hypothetical protein
VRSLTKTTTPAFAVERRSQSNAVMTRKDFASLRFVRWWIKMVDKKQA